ncbi:MAG: DUF3473 domain-containing protein [Bacteroidota bacterium]|nr:DUF3473 domain-containing protein [Bacteroidota bacterium]
MGKDRHILLSFDVEEFDLPLEYGHQIPMEKQIETGINGLKAIDPFLTDPDLKVTLFTTAHFALQVPDSIRSLAEHHEIASHTYYHSSFDVPDLLASRLALEKISGTNVNGIRMPRMRDVLAADLLQAGYTYDSSINPTWIPGRYNHFNLPRTTFLEKDLTRIPASVSPLIRVPLFWLSFKNLPFPVYKSLALQTLQKDGYLCLYFHPWEFTDLSSFGLPVIVRKIDGNRLQERLQLLLTHLKKEADFITIQDYLCLVRQKVDRLIN